MKSQKILESEIQDLRVSSLPTKPTAPASMGGRGYGSKEMKEAFDKLPLFIIERFNALIDDITGQGENSVSAAIPTGLKEGHSLSDMFSDVTSGEFGTYCQILGESLISHIIGIRAELSFVTERLVALEAERENSNA